MGAVVPTLVFRSSFRFLWVRTATLGGPAGSALYATSVKDAGPNALLVALGIAAAVAAALAVFFALAVWAYPVCVRADGIRGHGAMGFPRTIRWEDMAAVRDDGMAGFRYLVVSDRSGWRELWVPLFLSDLPGFAVAVRACVDADHVLPRALDRAGH